MTSRTAPSSDGLLAEVFRGFLSRNSNARRSVHRPWDHYIITLIISNRRDWCDTRGKWPLARNQDRSWCHRHTGAKPFLSQFMMSILPPMYMESWTAIKKYEESKDWITLWKICVRQTPIGRGLMFHALDLYYIIRYQIDFSREKIGVHSLPWVNWANTIYSGNSIQKVVGDRFVD